MQVLQRLDWGHVQKNLEALLSPYQSGQSKGPTDTHTHTHNIIWKQCEEQTESQQLQCYSHSHL